MHVCQQSPVELYMTQRSSTYRPAHNPTEGIPGPVVKPVEEVVVTVHRHVVSGSIVKPKSKTQIHYYIQTHS